MDVSYRISGTDDIRKFGVICPDMDREEAFVDACDKLSYELCYSALGKPGTRNESAVNILCCLRTIYPGLTDDEYVDTADNLVRNVCYVEEKDADELKEHFERVAPYLDSWGPDGEEEDALDYML